LDARLPDKTTESGADAADPCLVRFAVVFSTDHHSPDRTLWSWQETEIRLIERPKEDGSQVSPPIDSAHLVDQMIMEPPSSSSLPKRSLLASSIFQKPTAPSKRQKISKGLTLDNSLQPSGNDTKTIACLGPDISHQHHIKDLCLTFRNLVKERAQGDQSIGYFTCGNEPEALQLYSPHASEEQGPRQQPTVSLLADSLSKSKNICIANPSQGSLHLNRADRLELALTISSSILQLHHTPWLLSERLTKQDIQLHTHSLKSIHESNPQRNHQRQHAFVSSTFGSRSIGATTARPSTALPFPSIPRNPTLFALSILLIELCLGHPFESLRNPTLDPLDANGKPNILTDISAADRLLEDVYREAGNRYGDAVRRCVHCDFNQRKTTLEDDEFKQAVYEGVLVPLREVVKDFEGLD